MVVRGTSCDHTLQEGQEVEMEHRTRVVSPQPPSAGQ